MPTPRMTATIPPLPLGMLSGHAECLFRSGLARPRIPVAASGFRHFIKTKVSNPSPGSVRKWASNEVDSLREYPAQGLSHAAIASKMYRSNASIQSKAARLHRESDQPYARRYYTAAEDHTIREWIQSKMTTAQLLRAIPNRTYTGLIRRAQLLRTGALTITRYPTPIPWTEDEEKLLVKLREQDSQSFAEVMKRLPLRSLGAVMAKYRMLRPTQVIGVPRYRPWTDAEDAVVKDMLAQRVSLGSIATALSRTYASVARRLKRSSYTRIMAPSWSEDEITLVRDLRAQSKTYHEIASLLPNRAFESVKKLCLRRKFSAPH